MAYGIKEAIDELYIVARQPPYGLSVFAVQTAATKCGMELKEFLNALKAARAPLSKMLELDLKRPMDVWKWVVELSKSEATTVEFTEAVAATGGVAPPAMGLLSLLGWGLALGVVVVAGIGGYYYMTTASPIKAGLQMLGLHSRQVAPVPQRTAAASDPYGVFVGGGYNEVIVGQLSVIMGTPSSSLIGWGLNPKPVRETGANFRMVLGPFRTANEARQAYDANKIPGTDFVRPAAQGTVARFRFDGNTHSIDNALRVLR